LQIFNHDFFNFIKKNMKLKSLYAAALIALTLNPFSPNTIQAQNIILNPGFEASANAPNNWIITGPIVSMKPQTTIDNQIRNSGQFSLKMKSENPNCHGRAVQTVEIKGDQTYLFNARFMFKDVSSIDKSVLIRIKWFRGDENIGYNYVYEIAGESDGWKLASNKIKPVEGATSAEISLEFRWSTGTIWWDDISMEPCPDEPARNVKVGTIHFRPPGPTVEKNISLMGKLLDEAGAAGCGIVCLGEGWPTCNTDIGMKKNEVNTIGGSASKMMAEKAKKYNMYVVSGLYNWVGDTLYNVAVLYDRQGKIQGTYTKVQLPDSETEAGAVPGNSFPVFTTDFGKIGILICYDNFYPEVARNLALNGAEILFNPIWGDIRGTGDDVEKTIARSRAIDNGVYFVNSIYDGTSVIINPAGEILQETNKQGTLITATIDLNFNPAWDWVGNAGRGVWKDIWRKDRRSDLYNNFEK
jgi:predicted amidohydrolase